ncbi:hypothetical protein Tco_0085934 [Tanacetum coccineum]
MRTKRNQKIPQILKDYVHSIKNTKKKNKTNVSARNSNVDVSIENNDSQIGEKSVCNREGRLVDEEMSGNVGFVDDPNGDQFLPISVQDKVDDLDEIKDCLDQEISDNGNCNIDDENSANRNDGCVNEPVCKDKIDKFAKKESDVNEESTRGVWSINFADIVKANKIDNKLVEISTEINENGNEVVVLNDEMIESVCEKWKYIICGFFVGGQVTYSEARYHLRRMWNQFGYMDLMKNDGGKWRVGMMLDRAEPNKLPIWVRISQESQENSQKRASTDTRIRRVQKEAKEIKPQSNPVKDGQ